MTCVASAGTDNVFAKYLSVPSLRILILTSTADVPITFAAKILLILYTLLLPEVFVRTPTSVVVPIPTLEVIPVIAFGFLRFGAVIIFKVLLYLF
jgi:hypothetical protein